MTNSTRSMISYNTVASATYGNTELSSFELRGQWGYRVRKTGVWQRASYVTCIREHIVELKIVEDMKHRGSGQYGICFMIDGVESEVKGAKGKPGIGRWLLGVWKQVLIDFPDATFTCKPYSKDGEGATRARWYTKLGFRWNTDGSALFFLS